MGRDGRACRDTDKALTVSGAAPDAPFSAPAATHHTRFVYHGLPPHPIGKTATRLQTQRTRLQSERTARQQDAATGAHRRAAPRRALHCSMTLLRGLHG
jgi:hypothetical protein